jgi:hypothetical protein
VETHSDIPAKFRSKLHGPFRIIGIVSKNSFRLQHTTTLEILSEAVNVTKLRKFYEKAEDKPVERETFVHEVPFKVIEEPKEKSESDSEEDEELIQTPLPPPIPHHHPLPQHNQPQPPALPPTPQQNARKEDLPINIDLPLSTDLELTDENPSRISDTQSTETSHEALRQKSDKTSGYGKVGKNQSKWLEDNERFVFRNEEKPPPRTTRSGKKF